MILGGDIGGTKTLLAARDGETTWLSKRYLNARYASFDALLEAFLSELRAVSRAPLERACLAVAGPVMGGVASLTNLPAWRLEAGALAVRHALGAVHLVNDFAAVAWGLASLTKPETRCLQAGNASPQATLLALGPGTGLGAAVRHAGGVLPSEGGHVGFSPFDQDSLDLWRFLGAPVVRVNVERVVSGRGLTDCYRYCLHAAGGIVPPHIAPAEVVAAATGGGAQTAPARRALALFSRCFGAVAGDLALAFLPHGGVYLAGGMTAKLPAELFDANFLATFRDKAESSALNATWPIHVVLVEDLGLRGALTWVWTS